MKRRKFIALVGGAAVAWPIAANAKPAAKMPRVGIIDDALIWDHFRRGLHARGYVEGRNIAIEYRRGEGRPERLASAAAELAGEQLPLDGVVPSASDVGVLAAN